MRYLLRRIYNRVFPEIPFPSNLHAIRSYSQSGEDLMLDALFGCRETGTYVDIGANDPVGLNNTKRFYDRGWRGINIEPNPVKFAQFMKDRPHDINLNTGVSDGSGSLPFYSIDADTLSTFDRRTALQHCRERGARIVETLEIPVMRLEEILAEHIGERSIDFMSIDVEGAEMGVLRGNDWQKFRPKAIIIEIADNPREILDFLTNKKYLPVMRNAENGLFIDANKDKTG